MFWLIKQVFIALLTFSWSLVTTCKPTFTDLNPVQLNYYPFMISLDKQNKSCNALDDLYKIIYVSSKTKQVNIKVLNLVTRKP